MFYAVKAIKLVHKAIWDMTVLEQSTQVGKCSSPQRPAHLSRPPLIPGNRAGSAGSVLLDPCPCLRDGSYVDYDSWYPLTKSPVVISISEMRKRGRQNLGKPPQRVPELELEPTLTDQVWALDHWTTKQQECLLITTLSA